MPDLRANVCPKCSAPLQVGPYDLDVQCRYCGTSVRVRDPAPPPPPPPVSQFGHGAPMHPAAPNIVIVMGPGESHHDHHFTPAVHAAHASSWIIWAVVMGVVALTAIPGALLGTGVLSRKTSLPTTCGVNGRVVVEGKDVGAVTDTLVHAGVNCEITLKRVRGKTEGAIVEGGPNLKIVIEDSDIEAGGRGLDVGPNATVTLRRTKIRAKDDGVKADTNLDLTCDGCSITSQGTAVAAGMNAKIKLSNQAALSGATDGVDLGISGSLEAQGSKISGRAVGVHGGSTGLTLRLRGGTVVTGATAVHGSNSVKVRLEGATLEGKEIGLEADSVDFEAKDGTLVGPKAALSLSRAPSSRSGLDKLKLDGPLLIAGQPDAPKPIATATTPAATMRPPTQTRPPAAPTTKKK